jgi:hypothetical protein
VAGEIVPPGRTPNLGAIGKLLERFSTSAMAGRHGAAERMAPEQLPDVPWCQGKSLRRLQSREKRRSAHD